MRGTLFREEREAPSIEPPRLQPNAETHAMDADTESSYGEPSSLNEIRKIVNDHIEHVQGWMEVRDGESRGQYHNLMNDIRARDETVGQLLGTHHSLDLRLSTIEKRFGDFITSMNTKFSDLERKFH